LLRYVDAVRSDSLSIVGIRRPSVAMSRELTQ
jgi:hypothetical protein